MPTFAIHEGDCRRVLGTLPAASVHCVVTSPPYLGLRDYGLPPVAWPATSYRPMPGLPAIAVPAWEGCLGLEPTPEMFVAHVVDVFREVWRVLRDDGTCWVNFGDSYVTRANGPAGEFSTLNGGRHAPQESRKAKGLRSAGKPDGMKHKDLMGIPWRVAFALQAEGWYLRSDCIWHKPNAMPESVEDRPAKAHEYFFLLTKRERYFYDAVAVMEPTSGTARPRGKGVHPKARKAEAGVKANESFSAAVAGIVEMRNKRTVWTVPTKKFEDAHFATFPPALIDGCVLAGTSMKGCCPRCGAPWERQVEKYRTIDGERSDAVPAMRTTSKEAPSGAQGIGHHRTGSVTVTTGWEPGCACSAGEPVPCTVLDLFNGAGTSGLVACRHGRDYIGIEMNPGYAGLSRARIREDAPLFNHEAAPLAAAQ